MNTFMEKITRIQSELKAPKDLYNSFGKYKYRSCESILEAVKPLLLKEGLAINIRDQVVLIGDRYYVKATAIITDGDMTFESIAYAREEESKKGMDGAQITGASSSYARKYALNGLLAVDDTKDQDTDEHQHQLSKGTQQEPPRPTPSEKTRTFIKVAKDMGYTREEVSEIIGQMGYKQVSDIKNPDDYKDLFSVINSPADEWRTKKEQINNESLGWDE